MYSEPESDRIPELPQRVKAFCERREPYLPNAQTDDDFIDAMRDITLWHQQQSPWYRRFSELNGVEAAEIQTMDDVLALPPIHANFFKRNQVLSLPDQGQLKTLTSSGTTGQKSQMFFDEFTLGHARDMVLRIMEQRGVMSDQPAHYLVNAYEPYEGLKVGTSNTNQFLMQFAPVADQFWTLRYLGAEGHQFDGFGAINKLKQWAQGDTPVRIIGFPAFLHFILQRMASMNEAPLRLPEGSWVMFGGGWKGHADQAISREDMRAQIAHWLGIPETSVIESFGSVEHSIPYVTSRQHRLHQPIWSRVVIRDVKTLQPLPPGEPGFLSFVSPYITSVPAHSIVMGDMAVWHEPDLADAEEPPTPWFEILGRAGVSANKSCAVAAAEMLK
ncbi:MAG: hypothetical protein ACP5D0_09570 [Hydrogenovibrio sp.]